MRSTSAAEALVGRPIAAANWLMKTEVRRLELRGNTMCRSCDRVLSAQLPSVVVVITAIPNGRSILTPNYETIATFCAD